MVNCRYPKCKFLHDTTELLKDEAIQGGKQKYYYHPDCYHHMRTINEIRDLFINNINPLLTSQQIGQLVSVVNNMVFSKKIDVDYIKFALLYYINYKPNALKFPAGMHYIVQNRDVEAAWKKEQESKIKAEIREEMKSNNETTNIDDILLSDRFQYTPPKPKSFADILH